jgi:hypothetical protein
VTDYIAIEDLCDEAYELKLISKFHLPTKHKITRWQIYSSVKIRDEQIPLLSLLPQTFG